MLKMGKLTILVFILSLFTIQIVTQDINTVQAYAEETLKKWIEGWNPGTIPQLGSSACILTFGSESYPVFQTDADNCGTFGAAARSGLGRIAVFGNGGHPGNSPILDKNVNTWLAKGSYTDSQILNLNNINESQLLSTDLNNYKILTWSSQNNFPSANSINKLEAYIKNGGSLLAAYQIWILIDYQGYSSVNDFSMNKLLNRFGIILSNNYPRGANPSQNNVPIVKNLNAFYAIVDGVKLPTQQNTVQLALELLPIETLKAINPIYQFLENNSKDLTYPVTNPTFNSIVAAQYLFKKYDDINNPKAMNGIDTIPGVVSVSQRISPVITVAREQSDSWISTGYYLNAGEVLKITALTPIQNWYVRIGCHTDNLAQKGTWNRPPIVTKQVKLASSEMKITSPFGGLIYLVSSGSACTSITVKLENVVEAPFFDLTNPKSVWNVNAAGPIAEIQGKYLTMSIPTNLIKNVNNPADIANYWDKIVYEFYNLKGLTVPRRERFVADLDISAGYMHSGYPIMTFLDVVTPGKYGPIPYQLDVASLNKDGSWGHFHELGHNMQRDLWTFEGTGEVTNNIFSLLGGYICCGYSALKNPWLKDTVLKAIDKLNTLRSSPPSDAYASLRSDSAMFLVPYAFIQEYFGWDAFRKTFASYEASTGPRPSSNQDKIDVWVKQLSIAVGKNLLPYYDMWRMPISDAAVKEINALKLPYWLPGANDYGISSINKNYMSKLRKKYNL